MSDKHGVTTSSFDNKIKSGVIEHKQCIKINYFISNDKTQTKTMCGFNKFYNESLTAQKYMPA